MQSSAATQIILERTLIGEGVQNPATVAWNLAVGLYHKANGRPWRLRDADPGSCFVGVRFYQEKATLATNLRTSLAQIFSHRGEGIILRGSRFVWENPDLPRTPHLQEDAAAELARRIVGAYQNAEKSIPRRVVLHKSSRFWDEEREGFRKGFQQEGVDLVDLIAIGQRGIRLVRTGDYPVLRGTMLSINQTNFVLYSRGYIPYLGTYPGAHVPNPLEVLEHLGDASDLDIAREILALTKLNWNSADFSSGFPITIEFAGRVAEVLSELDDERITPNEKYRYYM